MLEPSLLSLTSLRGREVGKRWRLLRLGLRPRYLEFETLALAEVVWNTKKNKICWELSV